MPVARAHHRLATLRLTLALIAELDGQDTIARELRLRAYGWEPARA